METRQVFETHDKTEHMLVRVINNMLQAWTTPQSEIGCKVQHCRGVKPEDVRGGIKELKKIKAWGKLSLTKRKAMIQAEKDVAEQKHVHWLINTVPTSGRVAPTEHEDLFRLKVGKHQLDATVDQILAETGADYIIIDHGKMEVVCED